MYRRALALVVLVMLASRLEAQTPATVTLNISGLTVGAGGPFVPDGSKICVLTTDLQDRPTSYRLGLSSGLTSASSEQQDCRTLTGGSSTALTVINSGASSPMNACVRVSVFDPVGAEIERQKCVQPGSQQSLTDGWCTASGGAISCNLAAYAPRGPAIAPQTQGPRGEMGPAGPPGTPGSADGAIVNSPAGAQSVAQPPGTVLGINNLQVLDLGFVGAVPSFIPNVPQHAYSVTGYGNQLQTSMGDFGVPLDVNRRVAFDGQGNFVDAGTNQGADVYSVLQGTQNAVVTLNRIHLADGCDLYTAAPTYGGAFAFDMGLSVLGHPENFSAHDLVCAVKEFSAAAPSASGAMAAFLLPRGTKGSYTVSPNYYSGFDQAHVHELADPAFGIPEVWNQLLIRQQALALSLYGSYRQAMRNEFASLTLDSTTGCPVVTAGREYVVGGFLDGIRKTGVDVMGCWMVMRGAGDMANLASAAGNSADQTYYTNIFAKIQTALRGTSLIDPTTGLFRAATGQNAQPSIGDSAMICHLSYISSYAFATASQCGKIETYFSANYATMQVKGFWKNSLSNFAATGYIPASGGPPYANDPGHPGTNGKGANTYQDYPTVWGWAAGAADDVLNHANPSAAQSVIRSLVQATSLSYEFFNGTNPAVGADLNMETLAGPLGFLRDNPRYNDGSTYSRFLTAGGGKGLIGTTSPQALATGLAGENPIVGCNRASLSEACSIVLATDGDTGNGWRVELAPGDAFLHLTAYTAGTPHPVMTITPNTVAFVRPIYTGSADNRDLAGQLTLAGGSATRTFDSVYQSPPVCIATDTSTLAAVRLSATISALTLEGPANDIVNYICIGRN